MIIVTCTIVLAFVAACCFFVTSTVIGRRTAALNLELSNSCYKVACLEAELKIKRIANDALHSTNQKLKADLEAAEVRINAMGKQLHEAAEKLTAAELAGIKDSLFKQTVTTLVGFGVPGFVLLTLVAVSGYFGAAAITSSLALLGGPYGMLGGALALVAIGLAAKCIAEYTYPKIAQAVLAGLKANGETRESIMRQVDRVPRLIIPKAGLRLISAALQEEFGEGRSC